MVPDLVDLRCAGCDRQDERAHRHLPRQFLKLVANEQVVEVDEFETDDPALRREVAITSTLSEVDDGTEVIAVHEGLPPGVSPADNDTGWRMALATLAALVETSAHMA
ncbi:MAG TPA: SRPBCC domain-containing protein [Vicinamibacterales bacterium]|nr:SRPBCC domain-containing protein [Vicinamibacterales bacterium]